ncbi:hypothetical protein ANTQUA_LOCUS1574 [Anthophora quadrimaculata]
MENGKCAEKAAFQHVTSGSATVKAAFLINYSLKLAFKTNATMAPRVDTFARCNMYDIFSPSLQRFRVNIIHVKACESSK